MGAIKLNTNMPALTENEMDNIFRTLVPEIEDLRMGDGYTPIEKTTAEGVEIYTEVDAEGFSYRKIELINVSVSNSHDDEKYSEELFNMLLGRIEEMNLTEEIEYENAYAI